MSRARTQQIDKIIRNLGDLKKQGFENMYALDENIKFFEAMRSPIKYVKWFINERPKINGSQLLELSDFPLGHGRWEAILQTELLEIEQWKFPDNLVRFRKILLNQIDNIATLSNQRPLLLMSLGSGSMEIERQIIFALKKINFKNKITFIGVDLSQASLDTAKNNLKLLDIPIEQVSSLNEKDLNALQQKYTQNQFTIILLKDNVFNLDKYLNEKLVDLLYHTKFRHHILPQQKEQLDTLVKKLSKRIVEADLLNNLFMFIVPLIARTRWWHPILLNGGMFSSLRCPTKQEILDTKKTGWDVKVFPDGYIRSFNTGE